MLKCELYALTGDIGQAEYWANNVSLNGEKRGSLEVMAVAYANIGYVSKAGTKYSQLISEVPDYIENNPALSTACGVFGAILEAAKEDSDRLLLNILPIQIAEELKKNNKVEAKGYSMVTVLFADIKNFTKISEKLSPDKIIEELDFIFGAFDTIIEKHNIEKIKVGHY